MHIVGFLIIRQLDRNHTNARKVYFQRFLYLTGFLELNINLIQSLRIINFITFKVKKDLPEKMKLSNVVYIGASVNGKTRPPNVQKNSIIAEF